MNPDSLPEFQDYDYYEGRDLTPPRKEEFTHWYVYNAGELVWQGGNDKRSEFVNLMRNHPDYVHQKVLDVAGYKEAQSVYRRESGSRVAQFRKDLLASAGLDPENPKVKKLYELAWEYGHAAGYREVRHYFEDLLPLIL